jgi:hypothetical protein
VVPSGGGRREIGALVFDRSISSCSAGTQFTCFTGTKVQILAVRVYLQRELTVAHKVVLVAIPVVKVY